MKIFSKLGFSLVELLIVIAVIGVLTSVLVVVINPSAQIARAHDAQRKSDLRQIQSALEMYRSDNGTYPPSASFPACGNALVGGTVTYLSNIPCDPKKSSGYYNAGSYYYRSSTTSTYVLEACLENGIDNQGTTTSQASSPAAASPACDTKPAALYYSVNNP